MIYLDNAATSFPKAPGVAEAVERCIRSIPGSPGRASHRYAVAAAEILYDARERLAAFFGIGQPERLAFCKNATEAINLALRGFVKPGMLVVTSPFEHNSVMRPLRRLEAGLAARVKVFASTPGGSPDYPSLQELLDQGPGLLVMTAASNVTGACLPVAAIAARARAAGVPVLVDASQLVGHRRIDAGSLGADLLAFSGHKGLLGTGGTGGLYVAPGIELEPLVSGGTGSASELEEQPRFLPDRLEAGTQNIAAIAGLDAALRWLEDYGKDRLEAREAALRMRLATGLRSIPDLSVLPCDREEDALPVISAVSSSMPMADLASELDRRDIAIRMGLHCAPAAHRAIGTFAQGGSLRFSPGIFTTESEIDETLSALRSILR